VQFRPSEMCWQYKRAKQKIGYNIDSMLDITMSSTIMKKMHHSFDMFILAALFSAKKACILSLNSLSSSMFVNTRNLHRVTPLTGHDILNRQRHPVERVLRIGEKMGLDCGPIHHDSRGR
jgi:hypothetical protein